MPLLNSAVNITHDYIQKILKFGDIAVDATMGAGRDTAFLASIVGEQGKVYAFDIQQQAMETTQKLLNSQKQSQVSLILDGHQNMDRYIDTKIKVAMFNLGYLPGGSHSIGTKAETTISAINKSLALLEVGGIVTVAIYYGGDSGFEEKNAVMEFLKSIDFKKFAVLVHEYVNQPNCPPIAVVIEKLRS